jgi:hypothetical protein
MDERDLRKILERVNNALEDAGFPDLADMLRADPHVANAVVRWYWWYDRRRRQSPSSTPREVSVNDLRGLTEDDLS